MKPLEEELLDTNFEQLEHSRFRSSVLKLARKRLILGGEFRREIAQIDRPERALAKKNSGFARISVFRGSYLQNVRRRYQTS